MTATGEALLTVENLRTVFRSGRRSATAVSDVSFAIPPASTLALVGESGSGKSVTALSILRLIASPPGEIESGKITLTDRGGQAVDLLSLEERAMRGIRGNEIGMIFQEPMSSLNPLLTVGEQIAEVVRLHRGLNKAEAKEEAVSMLARVGIADPERRAAEYPHRLSGGMRQRVMIAMALSCAPQLLIADEPTTALDVTVQAQILDLMRDLQQQSGMSILFITHNLGVVAQIADRVAVMYAGRIVEHADVNDLFATPHHPYTRALLASMPDGTGRSVDPSRRLAAIPGQVPSPANLPPGCTFAPRCPLATERCRKAYPPEELSGPSHMVRCYHWRENARAAG